MGVGVFGRGETGEGGTGCAVFDFFAGEEQRECVVAGVGEGLSVTHCWIEEKAWAEIQVLSAYEGNESVERYVLGQRILQHLFGNLHSTISKSRDLDK